MSRSTTVVIALEVASSAFWRNLESGTSGPPASFVPVTPCRRSSASAGALKASAQMTSLARRRCICEARAAAALLAFFVEAVAPSASESPVRPLTRNWSA